MRNKSDTFQLLLGRAVIVELLIQNGVNLNSINEYSDTAMHFAANNGNSISLFCLPSTKSEIFDFLGYAKIISLLTQNGANYNAINKNGNTPLHLAANNSKVNQIKN